MKSPSAFALILALLLPIPLAAAATEWSVWDTYQPLASNGPAPPARNMNVLPTWTMGRQWLPDLSDQRGRLWYIGDMHGKASACINSGDPSFSVTDLNELQGLWAQNSRGLTDEQIWPVYYGLMHRGQGGGTPISNASCAWAKAWFLEDAIRLDVAAAGVPATTP